MTPLQIVWAYVKKYWAYAGLIILTVIGVIMMRHGMIEAFAEQLKSIQDSHDEELKKLAAIRAEEEKQHKQNIEKLQSTLALVQKQYDEARKELDAKKKSEIEKIIKKYKDDPKALADRLSESTGFQVILPEE